MSMPLSFAGSSSPDGFSFSIGNGDNVVFLTSTENNPDLVNDETTETYAASMDIDLSTAGFDSYPFLLVQIWGTWETTFPSGTDANMILEWTDDGFTTVEQANYRNANSSLSTAMALSPLGATEMWGPNRPFSILFWVANWNRTDADVAAAGASGSPENGGNLECTTITSSMASTGAKINGFRIRDSNVGADFAANVRVWGFGDTVLGTAGGIVPLGSYTATTSGVDIDLETLGYNRYLLLGRGQLGATPSQCVVTVSLDSGSTFQGATAYKFQGTGGGSGDNIPMWHRGGSPNNTGLAAGGCMFAQILVRETDPGQTNNVGMMVGPSSAPSDTNASHQTGGGVGGSLVAVDSGAWDVIKFTTGHADDELEIFVYGLVDDDTEVKGDGAAHYLDEADHTATNDYVVFNHDLMEDNMGMIVCHGASDADTTTGFGLRLADTDEEVATASVYKGANYTTGDQTGSSLDYARGGDVAGPDNTRSALGMAFCMIPPGSSLFTLMGWGASVTGAGNFNAEAFVNQSNGMDIPAELTEGWTKTRWYNDIAGGGTADGYQGGSYALELTNG